MKKKTLKLSASNLLDTASISSSSNSIMNLSTSLSSVPASPQMTKKNFVSTSIAPPTMFLKNQGQNTADLIKETNQLLNKHAYKIMTLSPASSSTTTTTSDASSTSIGSNSQKSSSNSSISSNVRLLREVSPLIPYPDIPDLKNRPKFENKVGLKGSGLGSMVKAASSTSYRQKYTTY